MDRQHGKQDGEPDDFPPDRELIERVRGGDLEAYDPLYQRHSRSALLHARHWARTEAAAEDLRAEAFTRVLHAIRNGNGPTEAFRPYLLTTMRHVARDWAEGDRRLLLVPDLVDLESPGPDADPVIAALERSLAGQAYMTLPERWQTVLWHTEVEGEGPAQLAPKLGIEPAAVAALAYRAREGLKQAYLQAHITEIGQESCRPYAEKLGAAARNRLGPREKSKVNAHLRTCVECSGLLAMLKYVNAHIGVQVGTAVVGTAVATKVLLVVAMGASTSANAAHAGLLGRARNASPRQQAVAVTVAAALAAMAIALALTGGNGVPAPAAPEASKSPVAAPPPQTPPAQAPTASASAPPYAASSSASPAAAPPQSPSPPPSSAAGSSAPSPAHSARPSTASPPASPSASPSPHVMCPADQGAELDLLGLQLRVGLAGGVVGVGVSAGGTQVLGLLLCASGGPPTPF
jgi:RNA polymerase sigma factor (sigma-70 family)